MVTVLVRITEFTKKKKKKITIFFTLSVPLIIMIKGTKERKNKPEPK